MPPACTSFIASTMQSAGLPLSKVPRRPRLDGFQNSVFFIEDREDEHFDFWVGALDLARHFNAAHPWQAQIQQQHVRLSLATSIKADYSRERGPDDARARCWIPGA